MAGPFACSSLSSCKWKIRHNEQYNVVSAPYLSLAVVVQSAEFACQQGGHSGGVQRSECGGHGRVDGRALVQAHALVVITQ